MAARVFLFLVISVLAYRDGFCQEYALGKGRHLVEIGCKLPTPSTQCSMAVNYFAAALGFAAAGHCHLLKGKEKLSDADSEDCNKQLYFGMCVRKIEGQTKAQAVAEYLAQKPGALEEDELTVVVRALMKYWACPAESRGH